MSIKVATLVLKYGPRPLFDFLVLLALANHASDFGDECWPSVKTIAAEMRIGESTVSRSLKTLAADGWISVMRKSKDHKGNAYRIALQKLMSVPQKTPESALQQRAEIPESALQQTPESSMSALQQHEVSSTAAQCQLYSEPPYLMINSSESSKKRPLKTTTPPAAFVLPDWVPVEPWDHFIEMRTSMRKKPTTHAAELLVAKLDRLRSDGHDPGDVLDQSTASGWLGIFPLKDNANGKAETPPSGKEQVLTAEMVIAKRVQAETGIVSDKSLPVLCDVARRELDLGILPDDIVEAMARMWHKLQDNRSRLNYSWGAEAFYGEGYWRSSKTWPWKEGMRPYTS
jgi:predicted transcriptional regulator